MNNLTIQQFCQLETLKTDLHASIAPNYQYKEQVKDNLTVLELTDNEGNVIQELILVV
ncbi:hypothetical protein IQ255_16150 [Pleurocapsales cyanobacterium LEGE 10410]|nr:hypothetical protein [Pleurocapsales cyanobacterium LEGE 10410]